MGSELKALIWGEDDVAFAFGEDIDYNRETGSTRADDSQTYRDNDQDLPQMRRQTGQTQTFDETRGEEVKMAPNLRFVTHYRFKRRTESRDSGLGGIISRVLGGKPVDTEIDTAKAVLAQHLQSVAADAELDVQSPVKTVLASFRGNGVQRLSCCC